ncbi:hypothetical protein [Terricaulis silvestris]|uniref:Uncharacterized protein n=1 Tax=Terricaulis silvestris TaxID=2686094 RepID=A0A6I6MUN8_9CAUL|nr:hypothetical protein [Terricaulis silvestris]QGZ94883.1 hypothetical protein DSM104635_01716 [Terricaulis silvestris]
MLSEQEKRDRQIAREIEGSSRLANGDGPLTKRERRRASKRKYEANNRERIWARRREKLALDESLRERRREASRKYKAKQRALKAMTPEQRERELHRRQQARWAKANPDCIADAQRKWREKQDPELFRKYDAKRYALHAEKIKARKLAYYYANRERIKAKRRAQS